MADKTHVNFDKVGNYVRNKAYPEEIWRDKGKKWNFQKVYKNFSVVNRHHMHKEKRSVVFENERQQLVLMRD